jgi:hypothetical protein
VYARPPKLGLAKREDYQDSGAVQRRESEITEILEQFYPRRNTKPISSSFLAHGIVEFEKILAGAQPHPEDLYNPAVCLSYPGPLVVDPLLRPCLETCANYSRNFGILCQSGT